MNLSRNGNGGIKNGSLAENSRVRLPAQSGTYQATSSRYRLQLAGITSAAGSGAKRHAHYLRRGELRIFGIACE